MLAAAAYGRLSPTAAAAAHPLRCRLPAACRLVPVSLVCKRFAAAARSPDLLRDLDVAVTSLAALRSFTGFLEKHGQLLERLTLICLFGEGEEQDEVSAGAAVAACLAVAGAGGQLTELSARGSIHTTEWLPAMPSLRRLVLDQLHRSPLRICPAISTLTALRSLELQGPMSFQASTRLPASIESLYLRLDNADDLPEQASAMHALNIRW